SRAFRSTMSPTITAASSCAGTRQSLTIGAGARGTLQGARQDTSPRPDQHDAVAHRKRHVAHASVVLHVFVEFGHGALVLRLRVHDTTTAQHVVGDDDAAWPQQREDRFIVV